MIVSVWRWRAVVLARGRPAGVATYAASRPRAAPLRAQPPELTVRCRCVVAEAVIRVKRLIVMSTER